MTVDPGFAGGRFIPGMLEKIRDLADLRASSGLHYAIEVDGGCNAATFGALKAAGADILIVGSSGLFSLDPDIAVAWERMLALSAGSHA